MNDFNIDLFQVEIEDKRDEYAGYTELTATEDDYRALAKEVGFPEDRPFMLTIRYLPSVSGGMTGVLHLEKTAGLIAVGVKPKPLSQAGANRLTIEVAKMLKVFALRQTDEGDEWLKTTPGAETYKVIRAAAYAVNTSLFESHIEPQVEDGK